MFPTKRTPHRIRIRAGQNNGRGIGGTRLWRRPENFSESGASPKCHFAEPAGQAVGHTGAIGFHGGAGLARSGNEVFVDRSTGKPTVRRQPTKSRSLKMADQPKPVPAFR